jgi:hypothetical protein
MEIYEGILLKQMNLLLAFYCAADTMAFIILVSFQNYKKRLQNTIFPQWLLIIVTAELQTMGMFSMIWNSMKRIVAN